MLSSDYAINVFLNPSYKYLEIFLRGVQREREKIWRYF
jgi:hypothetical protein